MGGDMAHAHIAVNEQHHAVARAREIGKQLRVAAIMMAREVERFLADWPGADGVGDALERKAYGGRDRVIGNPAALRSRLAGRHMDAGGVDVDETDRGQIRAGLRDGDWRRRIVQAKLLQRFAMGRARANEEKGKLPGRDTFAQAGSRARHDFRTNPGRVARRHRYPGTSHFSPFVVAAELA